MIKFTIRKEDSQAKEQREQYQARLNAAESCLSSRDSTCLSYAEAQPDIASITGKVTRQMP